jgi:hypothetical protein
MRLTSRKKRSAIVVVLFHDFAFDVAILLASYIIDERADFLGRQQHQALVHLWGPMVVFAVYRGRLDPKRSLRLMNERRHDRRGWLYVANEIDAFTREDH